MQAAVPLLTTIYTSFQTFFSRGTLLSSQAAELTDIRTRVSRPAALDQVVANVTATSTHLQTLMRLFHDKQESLPRHLVTLMELELGELVRMVGTVERRAKRLVEDYPTIDEREQVERGWKAWFRQSWRRARRFTWNYINKREIADLEVREKGFRDRVIGLACFVSLMDVVGRKGT